MSYPNYIKEIRKKVSGKVLDLGCGEKKLEDSVGMDFNSDTDADVVHNLLDFPYPFEDEEFDAIFMNSVLEHINRYNYVRLFEELERILKEDGLISIHVPYFRYSSALANLEHVTYFGHGSLNQVTDLYVQSNFRIIGDGHKIIRVLKAPVEAILNRMPGITHNFISRFVPVSAMNYQLRKKDFKRAKKGFKSYQLAAGGKG